MLQEYLIHMGVWETFQAPQWIQGEALMGSQETKILRPVNHWKLHLDARFTIFLQRTSANYRKIFAQNIKLKIDHICCFFRFEVFFL